MPAVLRSNVATSESTMSNTSEPIVVSTPNESEDERDNHDDTLTDEEKTREGEEETDEETEEEPGGPVKKEAGNTETVVEKAPPRMCSILCNRVEFDLSTLTSLCAYAERAATRDSVYVVFGCGMAVGGIFGSYGTAFGVGFATNMFKTVHNDLISFVCVSAIVASSLLQLYQLELVGWYHVGSIMHKLINQTRIDPYDASSMTVALISCTSSSYFLAYWIWAVYAYAATIHVVEQS